MKQEANRNFSTREEMIRHLKKSGISVPDSQKLLHTGYYHGYKGYRFFREYQNRLPFTSYEEIYATIQYDTQIKSLLYSKMMYLETALKSVTVETIMELMGSSDVRVMYDTLVEGYRNPAKQPSENKRHTLQQRKLNLQNVLHRAVQNAYQDRDPKITHFFASQKYPGVPIWAVVEVLTLGDFHYLVTCLDRKTRDRLFRELQLDSAFDQERELLSDALRLLRDLRNAVAHNEVVYDTRFHTKTPPRPLRQTLQQELGLEAMTFRPIEDYVILLCYFLCRLGWSAAQLVSFVEEFEAAREQYRLAVEEKVAARTLDRNCSARLLALKDYLRQRKVPSEGEMDR